MKYRQLGRTGAYVSELALGAGTFGGTPETGGMDQATADSLVKFALDHGVNFFDTADGYWVGGSEEKLGQAVKNLGLTRSDLFVSSKVHYPMGPGPNDRGSSRLHIMDAIKASLKRLRMDHIDLYQLHSFDAVTPVEEILRAMDDLVTQGLIRYIGVSNWPAYRISKALCIADRRGWSPLATTQAYYCLSARDIERELVDCLREEGVGLLAWSPLDGGFLTGKFKRDEDLVPGTRQAALQGYPPVNRERAFDCVDVMDGIAREIGTTIPRIAIAWVLRRPGVCSVLLGARRLDQLADTLPACDVELSDDHMNRLDKVSRLPPEYPGWMFAKQAIERIPRPFKRKT